MRELNPLADFPAIVHDVKSMFSDKGIRLTLDLPETETDNLAVLHRLQKGDVVLRVVIYNDDEFQAALIARNKQP